MASVAALVPTRGRPGAVSNLLDTWDKSVCTDLVFALDDDDPDLDAYKTIIGGRRFTRGRVTWHVGPRMGLTGWTNRLAIEAGYAGEYEALITLGDDHRPLTPAWDRKLLDATRAMGGGWAYGDDGQQHENLPTAFLVTSRIVTALGWMLLPSCQHMYVDAAARDLARECGRLAYLDTVQVLHRHFTTGLSAHDDTYAAGYASWDADKEAYEAWIADKDRGLPADVQAVMEALDAVV